MSKSHSSSMRFTARNDYAFKKLFGTEENKDIMIEFLSLVTLLSKMILTMFASKTANRFPDSTTIKPGGSTLKSAYTTAVKSM